MQRDTFGRREPCPKCGSEDVRWRRRTARDVVLTALRSNVERLLHPVFGSSTRPVDIGSAADLVYGSSSTDRVFDDDQYAVQVLSEEYRRVRMAYDDKVSSTTASRFWKCSDCGQCGEVLDDEDLERALGPVRADLVRLEDELAAKGAIVSNPVDRSGIPAKPPVPVQPESRED